jgi:hypothetical protein
MGNNARMRFEAAGGLLCKLLFFGWHRVDRKSAGSNVYGKQPEVWL